jgi:hypothetical protein
MALLLAGEDLNKNIYGSSPGRGKILIKYIWLVSWQGKDLNKIDSTVDGKLKEFNQFFE